MTVSNVSDEIYIRQFMAGYGHLLFEPELKGKIESFLRSFSQGLDALISGLLTELRTVTESDAATIYVVDKNMLRFAYVQNETIANKSGQGDKKGLDGYVGRTIPIEDGSLCGYVAKTKRPILIGNARDIDPSMPFRYNDAYDREMGYATISVLTAPIVDDAGELAGVLQLLNHKDENGTPEPYKDWMLGYVLLLTENFFHMIARSLDRYRDFPKKLEAKEKSLDEIPLPELYDTIRGQLYRPDMKLNVKLPWLRNSGISWTKKDRGKEANISGRLLAYSDHINMFEDISTVIETMLTEARDATNADAGTFYLVEGNNLRFAYVQNDTLFKDNSRRQHYINNKMPISAASISGYVALKRKSLNIPDVALLSDSSSYSFNRSFDDASGYNTVSILAVPVLGPEESVIAVVQLINSKDLAGKPKAFDESDVRYVNLLAGQTMPFLTRSIMTRRLIESMLRMSNMRDPLETGAHVHRVGAFAAEIYHRWAENKGIGSDELAIEKDTLRLAAMLHDIGKVAVPDAVLKKPGKLTEEEYAVMKTHCSSGASMYAAADSRLERMAYQITLHHHQRWDGCGYTGAPDFPPIAGGDIPIYARITSVADVLDALVFSRVYKSAWTFENAMAELSKNAGTQFDPEVIDAASQVSETLKAIAERYK